MWKALLMLEFLKYIEGGLLFWEKPWGRRHRGGGGWGSSLGILGWRRAAGSLEPLAYTRSGLLPIPELVQLYFATLYYPKFPKFLLS